MLPWPTTTSRLTWPIPAHHASGPSKVSAETQRAGWNGNTPWSSEASVNPWPCCHKSWGPFIGVLPLAPTDPVHWCQLLYLYKASSPYNRRVEQRHALKRILGRQHRPLVTLASRSTKRDFLAALSELGAHVIKRRLNLDPGQFWRAAKGREFLDLPKPPVQLLLFPDNQQIEE